MGKRKRCKACRRKEAEAVEDHDMESWLCPFSDGEVWCSHSNVPMEKRFGFFCESCGHYEKGMQEMEEEELLDDADIGLEQESFPCCCDGKLCDRCPVGSCFVVKDDPKTHHPTNELAWVCPRFDVNKLPDGSWLKEVFLKLRKPEGGFC